MGHLGNIKKMYSDLRRHVDNHQTGVPDTESAQQILRFLYTPEEAELAVKLPLKPVKLSKLARRLGENPESLRVKLDRMADHGLVFDILRKDTGDFYYMLAPPIVGFMEMSFMRVRDDIDQKELAHLLHTVIHEDSRFVESIFSGQTQIGRTLVHEPLIPEDYSDILLYEQASALIEDSDGGALSLCYCRHIAEHEGVKCDNPLEICMSLYEGAEFVIRHGHGRPAARSELLDLLAQARERGLVQICDNVQKKPSYICNCCGCCCQQLQAISRHGVSHAVHTSNFIANVDAENCVGCGRCARRCPIGAIHLEAVTPITAGKHELRAVIDQSICLGCGVCVAACKKQSLTMVPRAKRVLTPVSTLERVLRMCLERGTLPWLLFEDPTDRGHRWMNAFLTAVLRLPPVNWAMMQESVQSRYIERAVSAAKSTMPGLANQL